MQNDLKQLIIDQANTAAATLPTDAPLKDRLAVLRLLVQADEQICGRAVTYAHRKAAPAVPVDLDRLYPADDTPPDSLSPDLLDTDEAP
jgi:hypothetical protein